ncbi:U32 family peptidase, partial [Escherichia coli]|uniref:U32 family peptidase n=1 Tax=Escherichia coli TaxID=562 RepID=UPI00193A48BD
YHALEEPTSLNTLELVPEWMPAKIASVKIEGRQPSPAYVTQVAKAWRQAIDRVPLMHITQPTELPRIRRTFFAVLCLKKK